MISKVDMILAGEIAPLGPKGTPSGMAKSAISGPVFVTTTGLTGDQQADLKNHGGVDKAIHHYPWDHYAYWQKTLPHQPDILNQPGAFGENISSLGMTEENVCLGDIYQIGTAILQVSQGRQPCWKLNARFEHKSMALDVQTTKYAGWYYRVLQTGEITAGDDIILMDRPHEDWPIIRLLKVIFDKSKDKNDLIPMADLEFLAEGWQKIAEKRLKSNHIEDWKNRLKS